MKKPSFSALALPLLLAASACSSTDGDGGPFGTEAPAEDGHADDGGDGDGDGDGDEDSGDGDGDGDGDGGPVFDVGGDGDGDGENQACDAVDILFVIDSSKSMYDEQVALGEAFPQFTDAIIDVLPPGTNVHVGVTTAEMSPDGSQSIVFPCDMPNPTYYLPPTTQNSGVNGAQGRLYQVPNSPTFFEFDTDASQNVIEELEQWFVEAALVGIGGSSEEMPLGGAGWAFDPVNDPTNAGFVRDEGAALVLFFVTDESDQTPIDGVAQGLIDRIAAAKQDCGGLECVAAGGTVRESCLGEDALGMFLDQLDPSRVHTEPLEYETETNADFFVNALRDNLSTIIGDLCEDIPPAG